MVMLATSYVIENDREFAAAIKRASDQVFGQNGQLRIHVITFSNIEYLKIP